MKKYLIVIEKTKTGYSAFSPDLPGCIASGKTKQEVENLMQESIGFHLEGLKSQKAKIPEPVSMPAYCAIPA